MVDQKLLMNCVLCFLIGFFFHSVMKFGFCGRSVEGLEADDSCESKGELIHPENITGCLENDECCINREVDGKHHCITKGSGKNCVDEQAVQEARDAQAQAQAIAAGERADPVMSGS